VKDNLRRAVLGFVTFVVVCVLGAFTVLAVFAQLRFQSEKTYKAEFTNVTGLAEGDFVRIAGVEVGKVKKISITSSPKVMAVVEFSADDTVVLTDGTRAAIQWADPIRDRYLALQDGPGGVRRLNPGDTIPDSRTESALDIEALLGGFRPLFRALDPGKVNALSSQLIQAFQGQGPTIGSFLSQVATFTNTLADRDALIQDVITNLDTVMTSLGGQSNQLVKTVDSLSQLIKGLAGRGEDLSNAVAYTNASAASVADLLTQARPPLSKVVHETDRTAGIVVADHDYFDDLLNTLPDTYKILGRLGLYGDYYSFYLCDLLIKVNGKGGQPVYVKIAGQTSGRCAPK
jgi:phospholipid/cholesterol/gamma-HCH transport system substrate-binding protein